MYKERERPTQHHCNYKVPGHRLQHNGTLELFQSGHYGLAFLYNTGP